MASNVKDDFQDFADRALRVPGIFAKGLADKFNDQFQRELSAVQWDWPRKTTRVNGSVVTSPRDIVDTGSLKRSQSVEKVKESAVETEYLWTWTGDAQDPYAEYVHNGVQLKNGTSLPGRPWTATAERVIKPDKIFEDILKGEI